MALGIVSNEDFEQELGFVLPIATVKDSVVKGRPEGTLNVPDSIRVIIGDTAIESGRKDSLDMAQFFDVSPSSASAYAKGATSTASYNAPIGALGSHINRTKARISKKASLVAKRAIDYITDEKLSEASATELASVARSMAGIVKDMEPSELHTPQGPLVQFVLHAPQMLKESSFDVIDVRDS